jgi:hypothetical protein
LAPDLAISFSQIAPPLENNNNLEKTVSDLPGYTLTPKLGNYTNEDLKEPGKELSCGYPCLKENKPVTLERTKSTIINQVKINNLIKLKKW